MLIANPPTVPQPRYLGNDKAISLALNAETLSHITTPHHLNGIVSQLIL